jgi:hypothetical protein
VNKPEPSDDGGAPAAIGAFETGLITHPRAACGEHQGHLYLLWGKNSEPDLSHYELYRGDQADFIAGNDTYLARVEPEPYASAAMKTPASRPNTWYYYRVRAGSTGKAKRALSAVFGGLTRAGEP